MIYFSFRFLLCNAIICIFLGSLLGLKNLLQRQLSACMQYNLSIIFLAVLIVPFLPINSARKKKIVVTEEALQYKDCVLKGLEELNQKLTAGISDEEMQVFFSVTDKMLENLAK